MQQIIVLKTTIMGTENQHQNLNEEEKFERELLESLRYYGYLFPGNSKEIERFETLYGDTEIDMPEHFQSLEKLSPEKEIPLDFDLSYNVAAFSANDQNRYELPDNLELNENDEDEDSQNDKDKPTDK